MDEMVIADEVTIMRDITSASGMCGRDDQEQIVAKMVGLNYLQSVPAAGEPPPRSDDDDDEGGDFTSMSALPSAIAALAD